MAVIIALVFVSTPRVFAASPESETILRELQRNDWQVRLINRAALEKMSKPQSTKALIRVIRNQGVDWRIQIRGIRLLGRIHTALAKGTLINLFNDLFFHQECPAVKSSLARALGNFHGPRVAASLIGGLDDSELLVREASVISLGKAGDASAVPYLIAQLKDKNFAIKSGAIHALGLLKDAKAIPSLTNIAEHDSDPILRREALSALSMIRRVGLKTVLNDDTPLVGNGGPGPIRNSGMTP